jgi:predicted RNA-binding Zn ribbon-like protein
MAGTPHELYEPPGRRAPAPGELAIVQDFANSHFTEAPEEDRERPTEPIVAWGRHHGLFPRGTRLSPKEVARVLELRRLLREAISANHGEQPMSATDVRKLNDIAQESAVHVRFKADGDLRLTSHGIGVDGLAARAFAIIAEARRDGTWSRLKICRADDCAWAFYDRSKNGSGSWCSMSECGNRAKAKAFRERKRK